MKNFPTHLEKEKVLQLDVVDLEWENEAVNALKIIDLKGGPFSYAEKIVSNLHYINHDFPKYARVKAKWTIERKTVITNQERFENL